MANENTNAAPEAGAAELAKLKEENAKLKQENADLLGLNNAMQAEVEKAHAEVKKVQKFPSVKHDKKSYLVKINGKAIIAGKSYTADQVAKSKELIELLAKKKSPLLVEVKN